MTTGALRFDDTVTSAEERRRFLELLALPAGARVLEAIDGGVWGIEAIFDGVLCIDAIAHVSDRARLIADWARVVKPGGRILYTDPAIVAGQLTSDEIALRSSMGLLVFSCQGENELLIEAAGLRLLRADDGTDAIALAASRLRAERATDEHALIASEGREAYDARQRFLDVAHRLAHERRLARIAFLAERSP
jgi:SAM-dependent methyltransferase